MENNKKEHRKDLLIRSLVALVLLLGIALIVPHISAGDSSSTSSSEMPAMTLKTFDVPAGVPVPTVSFNFDKDAMDGWDLHIETTNFTFTPEKINTAPVMGEGHVHLYIDGKLSVVFGSWYHVDDLAPGTHTIKVSLNNNDHSIYAVNGNYIEAQKVINVTK